MKRRYILVVFLIGVLNCGFGQAKKFYGTWEVFKVISDDYRQPALSNEEKKRDIGSKLTLNEEQMVLSTNDFSDTCQSPHYKLSVIKPNTYFLDEAGKKMAGMSRWLGYKEDKAQVIDTKCDSYWGRSLMIQDNRLILRMEGFFYYLKRKGN